MSALLPKMLSSKTTEQDNIMKAESETQNTKQLPDQQPLQKTPSMTCFPLPQYSRSFGGFMVVSITEGPKSAMKRPNKQNRRYEKGKSTGASMSRSYSWLSQPACYRW